MAEPAQSEQWRALYARVVDALRPFGTNDSFGEGDYSIVDENWGDARIDIVVNKIGVLSPQMIDVITQILRVGFDGWEVIVSLDIGKDDARFELQDAVWITSRGASLRWDAASMRRRFGESFRF